jgi:hypothetical protein
MSYKYLANSQNKNLSLLRKEYLDNAVETQIITPTMYPKTQDELYLRIKTLLYPHNIYYYTLEMVEDLFTAAYEFDNKNGQKELLSKLLWARVNTLNKRELINYLDKITEPGMGSKIFTIPYDAERLHYFNMDIRGAYIKRRKTNLNNGFGTPEVP